jgi:hypothetical protein
VRVEGSSAVTVHRAMLALRQRYPAAGFVQSLPDFARTLLRTRQQVIEQFVARALRKRRGAVLSVGHAR